MKRCDLVIRNGTVVLPGLGHVRMDLGVKDGKIAVMADALASSDGDEVVDARNRHVLPGAIDSRFPIGTCRPHAQDAESDSASPFSGGVTTILSYFRTVQHYLNKSRPYQEIFPDLLSLSAG